MKEVLSYLQISNPNLEQKKHYADEVFKKAKGQTIYEFYNQSFKTELITELFEGWKLNEKTWEFINKARTIYFKTYTKDNLRFMYCKLYGNQNYNMEFFRPRTLDDFICDCQRAGIKLEWKK